MDLFLSEIFLQFVIASILIELTPGPNMTYLAIVSASEGRKAGFATVIGVALGLLTVGVAAALGLSAIIANNEIVYQGLRFSGIAYLFWLYCFTGTFNRRNIYKAQVVLLFSCRHVYSERTSGW